MDAPGSWNWCEDVAVVVDSHTAEELDIVVELGGCNSALEHPAPAGAVGRESRPVHLERRTCLLVVEGDQRMAPYSQWREMARGHADEGFADVET